MSNTRSALVACLVMFACGGGDGPAPDDARLATASTQQAVTGQDGTVTISASNTILNQYAVLAADVSAGGTTITVTDINAFSAGGVFAGGLAADDLIMLYQPMGASIDITNTEAYGAVGTLGGAGNYELVHVTAVAGNTITIESTCGGLARAYTTAGRTQVIRVPQAASLVFSGAGASLIAKDWDGSTGGVVAIHVQGTATIGQGGINANGKGFRGGAVEAGSSTGSSVFVSDLATAGAQKGESIAGDQATYSSTFGGDNGRGAPANGGGGGDMDGAPGGGGANGNNGSAYNGHGVMDIAVTGAAAWSLDPAPGAPTTSSGGGRGGYSRSTVDLDPTAVGPDDPPWGGDQRRTVGGRGGHPLTNDPTTRLFMGGGGGAGATTSTNGGAGGDGGGLVLLIANTVNGTGTIQASGTAANGGAGDGPGGGGAGGTIVIRANALSQVALRADGGVGGTHTAGASAAGGGGGGGGGYIAISTGTPALRSAAGGDAGTTTSTDVNEFPVNGGTDGAPGEPTATAGVLPVCTGVDLTISKTNGVATSTPGTATTYTIVATNTGADVVAGATVADTFPAALVSPSWTCAASAGSTCPAGPVSGNINHAVTLAPSGTATFTVNATISAAATGTLANTATITAPAGITELDNTNNTATDTDTLAPSADLAITISDAPDPVNAAANITYTVGVSNAGPSNAGTVTVTDVLPAGTTFVSGTGTGWSCSAAAGTVTCTRASLAVGAAPNLAIVVQAPDEAGTVSNTVTVASTTTDPNNTNNSASASTTVAARADLSVAVTDSPDPVIAGGTLTYTVNVTNLGPSTAASVTVTDTLAASTTFVSATGTGWSCGLAGVVVTCTRATLAPGAAPAIAIVVTAGTAGGTINNTATVATTTTDPVAGNNSSTISTTVTASADLSITKTDSADPVVAGAAFSYSISITNNGPSTAATLVMTDPLPVGVGFVSASGGSFSCSQAAGTVTCTRGNLTAGSTAVITVNVTAPANGATLSNTASISAATSDPDNTNNSATEATTVTASADLAIAVADSPDPVNAGAILTYTITATNNGPSTSANVTVTDVIPATATFLDFTTTTGWTCSEAAGTITCTRAALATGVNQPIVFRVTAPTSGGTITNTAAIASATTADPNNANNAVSTNTTVTARADLSIAKIDDPDPVATGATLTYTISVANAGPSDATSLTMIDTLPANVAFVSADGTGWTCTRVTVTVTCTRASLGVGAAPPITIVVTAPLTTGTITNSAQISSAVSDPVAGNNTDSEQTTVTPTTDLAITATDSVDPIEAGTQLVYTVDVTNNGPITATGVDVTTTLPAELTFASGTGTGWTCGAAGQAVTCTRASLAIGAAPTLTITVDTDAPSGTTATTALTVGSDFADPTPGNNTVSIDTLIIDREIEITSTAFPDTFRNPGASAPIRPITVTNTGDATLHVTAITLTTSDPTVWTLLDTAPRDLPGGTSFDYRLQFSPTALGAAPTATVTITSDDRSEPTTTVTFTGNGIDRNVAFDVPRVDLGYTGVGVPVEIDGALLVKSMNSTTTFAITKIELVDDPACEDADSTANAAAFALVDPPVGDELRAMEQAAYDVRFNSATPGRFVAAARLFLDPDPVAQATVCVEGQAVFVDAHGGGGCSTGGDAGGGVGTLLGLGVIGIVLRRRRRWAVTAGVLAATAVPAAADKLAISIFDPTPATTGTNFQLQSADVGHAGDYVIAATFSHATDPLVLDGGIDGQAQVIQRSTLMLVGGAFAFLDRFEAGARIPLYLQDGAAAGDRTMMFTADPASGAAMGDITLHGKARLWKHGGAAVGAGLQLTIPTAAADSFTGTEKPSLRAIGLASLTPDTLEHRISLTGHFGGVARAKSEFANLAQGSGLTWGLGASVRALDRMWLSAEMFGDLLPAARKATATSGAVSLSPIEWLAGLRYAPDHRVSVGFAFGRGLTAAAGSPSLRGVLEVVYAPRAPELRPIRIPVQPKPDLDADGDGIRDSIDKCPNEPEDVDMFDDTDGCPDLDNDKDGVPDAVDRCPLDPEDVDKFEDQDGCPDKDNDADGIPDAIDKCPNEPEDKDGFSDVDGCPDLDNDNDGIPDAKDKCPLEPETINGNKDDDGCPDAGDSVIVLSPDRIETLDPIVFERGNKIVLAKSSFNVLGQIGATMRAHTEIVRMRVTVHVHPSGNYEKDQELTDKRAQAIRDWLVQYGVAANRVEARGFGSSKLLAPEDQKGAAEINNRVELIILERK